MPLAHVKLSYMCTIVNHLRATTHAPNGGFYLACSIVIFMYIRYIMCYLHIHNILYYIVYARIYIHRIWLAGRISKRGCGKHGKLMIREKQRGEITLFG